MKTLSFFKLRNWGAVFPQAKNNDNFLRVFEIANQLPTPHLLYLVPWVNGNAFYFWNVNKVDFFLLIGCYN